MRTDVMTAPGHYPIADLPASPTGSADLADTCDPSCPYCNLPETD